MNLQFPYSVIYKSEEKIIYIITIMHNNRKPDFWLKRLEEKQALVESLVKEQDSNKKSFY